MSSQGYQNGSEQAYSVTANYYDAVYAEESQRDGAFYLELAGGLQGPVLELGCGTGRIALALARAGHRVVGMDVSRAMLNRLRAKVASEPREVRERIELLEGDMAEFELGTRFGLVISPFRAMMHLTAPAQQRSCLKAVARHLAPEGRFVFNAFIPNLESIVRIKNTGLSWLMDHECIDPATDRVLRRFSQVKHDTFNQVIQVWFRYEEYDRFGKLLSTEVEQMQLRWSYCFEAQYLIELCGMQIEAAYGSYAKLPLDSSSTEQVYVCKRT